MRSNIKKRGDTALSELAKAYELVRDEVADRLDELAGRIDELDSRALGNRAYASAAAVRERVQKRAQKMQRMQRARPMRRQAPMRWGWLALGAMTLGLAWLLYDRRRREMIRGQVTQLGARTTSMARGRGISSAVDGVMGKVRGPQGMLDEDKLRSEVESAIAGEGGMPSGLQVAVEGRTVYLRGTVDPAVAESAANRAQPVDGVAAVVNLTTPPEAPEQAKPSATRRTGSA